MTGKWLIVAGLLGLTACAQVQPVDATDQEAGLQQELEVASKYGLTRRTVTVPKPNPAHWAVHLASYDHRGRAMLGWSTLRNRQPALAGLVPETGEVQVGERTYVRLLAGAFPTFETAEAVCRRMPKRFCVPVWVDPDQPPISGSTP